MYGLGKLSINNPGNLEKTKSGTPWQGEINCTSEPRFACFTDIAHGYRSMFILLRNYIVGGANTITKIVNKWAPPTDNNPTPAYINFVSQNSGINANTSINPNDVNSLAKIVAAMSTFENGVAAKQADVDAGKELAKSRFGEYAVKAGIGFGVIAIAAFIVWLILRNPVKDDES